MILITEFTHMWEVHFYLTTLLYREIVFIKAHLK